MRNCPDAIGGGLGVECMCLTATASSDIRCQKTCLTFSPAEQRKGDLEFWGNMTRYTAAPCVNVRNVGVAEIS